MQSGALPLPLASSGLPLLKTSPSLARSLPTALIFSGANPLSTRPGKILGGPSPGDRSWANDASLILEEFHWLDSDGLPSSGVGSASGDVLHPGGHCPEHCPFQVPALSPHPLGHHFLFQAFSYLLVIFQLQGKGTMSSA